MPPKATALEKGLAVAAFAALLAAIYFDRIAKSDRLSLWLYAATLAIVLFVSIRQSRRRAQAGVKAAKPAANTRLEKAGTWLIIGSGLVILVAEAVLPKPLATSLVVITVLGAPLMAGICLSVFAVVMRLLRRS